MPRLELWYIDCVYDCANVADTKGALVPYCSDKEEEQEEEEDNHDVDEDDDEEYVSYCLLIQMLVLIGVYCSGSYWFMHVRDWFREIFTMLYGCASGHSRVLNW
jgi:hypothetical protein